jgi:hypothetical protein
MFDRHGIVSINDTFYHLKKFFAQKKEELKPPARSWPAGNRSKVEKTAHERRERAGFKFRVIIS